MRTFVSLLVLALSVALASQAQVGTWRTYMSYYEPQQIVRGGNNLYVRASNGLYQYNMDDQLLTTYDKVTGLSDTDITHILWNSQARRLVVVYRNADIDLLDAAGNVVNLPALYRKAMTEDKTVDSLTVDGPYAYLYARFGIVKVNVATAEISDTYTPANPEYPTALPPSAERADWDGYIDLVRTLRPGGPKYNYFGFMRFTADRLYTTTYTKEGSRAACVQVLDRAGEWTFLEDQLQATGKTDHEFVKLACVDVDPTDTAHVIASGRTGVYEYQGGRFVREWNNDNSPIKTSSTLGNDSTNKSYVGMTGGKFDRQGNYWCVNSISPSTSLLELTSQGQWLSHHHDELMHDADRSFEEMQYLMFDSRGLLWFVNNFYRSPAFVCYDTETDAISVCRDFTNQDGTSYVVSGVGAIAEDLEGNIWVGTNMGPFYLPAAQVGTSNTTLTQVKVPRNDGTDYADYLLGGVEITAIAVDGAGRKWFGTVGNGLYLISADNLTELAHFTAANSPLLSDNVAALAIDNLSGALYIGTDAGLCSYQTDATTPADTMEKDGVYAYPNPVTPDYTGLITVVGLTLDADVKILTASGKLVAEGRSAGGTFTWDGTDRHGRRVASGVYMVATATSDGHSGTVCKIAIIK